MPKKKKSDESMLKKAEDIAEEVIEEGKEIAEKVEDKVEDVVEDIKESVEGKKKTKKKKEKKVEIKEDKIKKDMEKAKKELLEKAKKLSEKIDKQDTKALKEEVEKAKKPKKEKEKKKGTELLPLDEYVKSGIYIGTKVITPTMRKYVYRRRNDGLAVLNTNIIDEKIKENSEILAKYKPEDVIVVCKREAGWNAVKLFSKLTGIRAFTKKYPAGIITNINLPDFFETELTLIVDPWVDKNALNDSKKINKEVMAICDTNNNTNKVDFIIPGNNKSNKSIGLIMYLLTKKYIEENKLDVKMPSLEEFTGELPKLKGKDKISKKVSKGAKEGV